MQPTFSSRRHFLQLIAAGAAVASIIPLIRGSEDLIDYDTTTRPEAKMADSPQIATAKQNIESLLLDSALKSI